MNEFSTEIIYVTDKGNLPVDKSLDKIWVQNIIDSTKPIMSSNTSGEFYLLDTKPGKFRRIQFLETGYTRRFEWYHIKNGEVKDPYYRSVMGLGYLGDYKAVDILAFFNTRKIFKRWYDAWVEVIRRSTGNNSTTAANKRYEDTWVHKSFHSCENFLRWVMRASKGKEHLLDVLAVDKDYYGAKYYSEHTCVLLTKQENNMLRSTNRWFIIDELLVVSKQALACYLTYLQPSIELITTAPTKDGYVAVSQYRFDKLTDDLKARGLLKEITPNTKTVNGNLVRFKIQDPMVEEEMKYKLYDYSEMIVN